jgi:hypothetical protein
MSATPRPPTDPTGYIEAQLGALRGNIIADLRAIARTCEQEAARLDNGGELPSSADFRPLNQQLEWLSNTAARSWALRVLRSELPG